HWLHDGSVGTDNCSEPVSVKDVANETFNVYPNPVTSKSTIYIEAVSEIESYRIVDYLGRELKINSNSIAQSGDGLSSIHLPSLSSGIYLIIVKLNDNEYSQKLV